MKLHDLLIELGTEELPSAAVKPLAQTLAKQIQLAFADHHIQHGATRFFATPRRLAVFVEDVASVQPNQTISKRGPAVSTSVDGQGKPLPALLGFANACGVSINALTTLKTEKGEWWLYESEEQGKETRTLLIPIILEALKELPIVKPMRWGDGDQAFSRPVHWAVLLYGDEVVRGNILGVETGDLSRGHRFLHPGIVKIASAKSYEKALEKAHVLADFDRRRETIYQQIQSLASEHQMKPLIPEALLEEITSIVEWPTALLATFDKTFLEVPPEALVASMQSHQKCIALHDNQGKLAPYFITVSNIQSKDPKQVVNGNEKVMRARLSDAAFFYHQDKKQALSHHLPATETVIFQHRLGSLADKATRVGSIMMHLIQPLELDAKDATRAAQLSKCDLLTGMVGEFPELQGLMGYYYAQHDGESIGVARALNEQYMPRFAADELPESRLGIALSLADRLDTLVGLFAIGEKPTGVKDPFKLRRHALAIIRILTKLSVKLNLSTLLAEAREAYTGKISVSDECLRAVHQFILERMTSYYQSQHITSDFVHAVRARQEDWLFDADERLKALIHFMQLPEASALSAACKRVNNLLSQSVVNLNHQPLQVNLLTEPAEIALFNRVEAVEQLIAPYYLKGQYDVILTELASIRAPLDHFFEKVMVMVDDPAIKQNRLGLLTRLNALLQGVADIGLLNTYATTCS